MADVQSSPIHLWQSAAGTNVWTGTCGNKRLMIEQLYSPSHPLTLSKIEFQSNCSWNGRCTNQAQSIYGSPLQELMSELHQYWDTTDTTGSHITPLHTVLVQTVQWSHPVCCFWSLLLTLWGHGVHDPFWQLPALVYMRLTSKASALVKLVHGENVSIIFQKNLNHFYPQSPVGQAVPQ